MISSSQTEDLNIVPITPKLLDPLHEIMRGSWGATCWCTFPRLTDKQQKDLPGDGPPKDRRRAAMEKWARRRVKPGLIAFDGEEPVGWIAVAPRSDLARVAASRATPAVDDTAVWVIPCITVRKPARGRGIATALIRAAVTYAKAHGAPTVEAYPRAGGDRTGDDNAFFGTEIMFQRAGFKVVRGPLENVPRNWLKRVTMRSD